MSRTIKITEMDQTIVETCDLETFSVPNDFIAGLIKEAKRSGTVTRPDPEGCPVTVMIRDDGRPPRHLLIGPRRERR